SPTMTRMATQAGMILGTAAYMSPEQARGKPADRRADIWAFGCLLFEMLTGKMTFSGETVSDTLAAIIKEQPDYSLLPANTSIRIRVLIQRCLQKDPRQRLQAIGDARVVIEEVFSGAADPTAAPQQAAVALPQVPAWRRPFPWAVAAALAIALLFAIFFLKPPSTPSSRKPILLSFYLPADRKLAADNGTAFVISPDGSRIAYVTDEPGSTVGQLYVRELDQPTPVVLATLENVGGAAAPFFSPDGQWIGFFGEGKLKKVSVRGGAPIALATVSGYRGGAWGEDDTIIFPTKFTSPLYRMPAAGGTPQEVTHLSAARAETTHRWPQILPGGKSVLFTASSNNNFFGQATVQAASLSTGEAKVIVENASFGRYLPGGYLAYCSQGTLFVVPFDAKSLQLTGTAVPVLQGIDFDISNGGVLFSSTDNGMAIYMAGSASKQNLNLVMLNRKGEAQVLLKSEPDATSPRLSPDGKKVAFEKGVGGIWIHDTVRGTTTPLALKSGSANFPIWTPDGEYLTYSYTAASRMGVGEHIYRRRADGVGEEEQLTPEASPSSYPSSWSPDGKTLAFLRLSQVDGACCDAWTMHFAEDGKPQEPQLVADVSRGKSSSLAEPMFSPDGHWIAYSSADSGPPQVYVVPFPQSGGKWQISTDGGAEPRWSKTGHELFYSKGQQIFTVSYLVDKNSFVASKPQPLFDGIAMRFPYTAFDVSADGQHFVAFQFEGGKKIERTEPTVVVNWLDEVRRQVAAGQSSSPK
ncbi:MAG TPA: protein kinase, partial [Candidatus Acidoferrum sp.]